MDSRKSDDADTLIVPLDGPLERNGYPPVLGLVFGLLFAFLASQVITAVALAVLLILAAPTGELGETFGSLASYPEEVFIANGIGQVFGLALLAVAFARLHSSRPLRYVRLRSASPVVLMLSVVGLAAIFPFVNWLAAVNQALPTPQPEWLQEIERSSMEIIESLLVADGGMMFPLLVLAVTPAVCEELLFRGYLQRQLERMGGAVMGVAASGILFGLYHLRLSQALPLCVLGIYLAYITWRTRSLWPAMLVHFAHNAFAVVYARTAPSPDTLDPGHTVEMPFYLVAAGLALFAGLMYAFELSSPDRNEYLKKRVRRASTLDNIHHQSDQPQ